MRQFEHRASPANPFNLTLKYGDNILVLDVGQLVMSPRWTGQLAIPVTEKRVSVDGETYDLFNRHIGHLRVKLSADDTTASIVYDSREYSFDLAFNRHDVGDIGRLASFLSENFGDAADAT